MYILLKSIAFIIYSIAVFFFTYYLSFTYLFYEYKNWLWSDVHNLEEYNYIIVGAGSAGSVLAARLVEAGEKTLLVEAGGMPPYFLDIPILAPLFQQTVYDWKYTTVSQQNACKGLINNQSIWPMGKILGGSSRLNYMAYVRGHPRDYDDWFPDFIEPIIEKGGPLHVSNTGWHTELSDIVLNGAAEMGHNIGNINKELDTGFMKVQLTIKNGERWSTDKVLKANRVLTIITNAHVNKVLFESNKATGIEYVKFNMQLKAMARKGIILSAGAIGSPKLLMLSGIGPKNHLEDLKIDVINDLPVGQNLMDHILTGIDLITLNTTLSLSMTSVLNPISAFTYFLSGKGTWTSAGIEVIGTFHSSLQENKSTAPDLQLMVMPVGVSQDNGIALKNTLGISDKIYQEYFTPLSYKTAVTIAPVLLHPKSTGEVKLRSSNPYDAPIIDPRYLSKRDDVLTLISGIQFVKQLIKTKAMRTLGASIYDKHYPGCEDKLFDSIEYWECYIRHLTLTSYHPAGTCCIGSVTDKSFRVYNTSNLYVIDASVLPRLPSGNIHAAVVMLAEKAARLLVNNKTKNSTDKLLYQCHKSDLLRYIFNIHPIEIKF